MIRAAKRGIYGEYSLRTTPGFIKARYFDVISEGRYKIKREVQQLVEFKQINLVDGLQIRQIDKSQVVFL